MGGGDLNLKKSWHPSTMKNMEKVWKAEQQENLERKRIAELKKEIEMEKDREDMAKYAMDQGVIEKKDDKKLDWMYKGPNQMVNREDYLLGKPVDKAFEQMAQAEKEADLNKAPKNHVEYECIPPSLRFFSGNEQVDLVRKMQEDPLYAIKKKEAETRNQLLKNPVKLKQLRGLLEQQSSKNKKIKKKSEQNNSDNDDEANLDMLLVAKYKQLKDNINKKDLLKSMKKMKHKKKKTSRKRYDSENKSDSSDSDTSVEVKREKRRKSRKGSTADDSISVNKNKSNTEREKKDNRREHDEKSRNNSKTYPSERRSGKRKSSKDRNLDYERIKKHADEYNEYHKRYRYEEDKPRDVSGSKYRVEKKYSEEKHEFFSGTSYMRSKEDKRGEEKWKPYIKHKLTEKEKEQRRQEMMENAVWRDKEREKNIKQYREEEKRETQNNKEYNQDFIRKQLVVAAEVGTVASRIKANINNIQRSGRAMDTNFARR